VTITHPQINHLQLHHALRLYLLYHRMELSSDWRRRLQLAVRYLRRCIESSPFDGSTLNNALVFLQLARKKPEKTFRKVA
jgi:hypothetical protein